MCLDALFDAESLLEVGNAQGTLQRADGSSGGTVQELVDLRETNTLKEHSDSFANGLDCAWRSTAIGKTEKLLGKGYTKCIFELEEC